MIFTIRNLKEIQHYLWAHARETLVVFDLDDTLIKTPSYEGSEAWYDDKVATFIAGGLTRREAIEKANDAWEKLQARITPVLIQSDVIEVLFRLHQQQKLQMMIITARRKELAALTYRQLESVGLSFDRRNIVFIGPHGEKGPALERHLESLAIRPDHCVCIDDRRHQIDSYFSTFRTLPPIPQGTFLHKAP